MDKKLKAEEKRKRKKLRKLEAASPVDEQQPNEDPESESESD